MAKAPESRTGMAAKEAGKNNDAANFDPSRTK